MGSCAAAFSCLQHFQRTRRHALAQLVGLGRHTISALLRTQNRHQLDWTADYRLYSQGHSQEQVLFSQIRRSVEEFLPAQGPLVVAMDDTLLRKTGRQIHGVRFQRDPLGPAFHINFVRGLRVLQISAAVPQGSKAARLVPIDFQHAVLPPKPSRKATPEQVQEYKKLKAQRNINCLGSQRLAALRQQMDQSSGPSRTLVAGVDGRFTNKTFLTKVPERTVIVGRIRKDAVVHQLPENQPPRGRKRKYGTILPTPEELLKDETIPFQKVRAFAAGTEHEFEIKHQGPVVMRLNRAKQSVRIMVIKPLGYRLKKAGRLLYRQAAFLTCTDPTMTLEDMLQNFLWRWDIEVNFRDEKTLLGVGQAQVRTEASNQKAPALAVAAYGMLLMASLQAYGIDGRPERLEQAKWYRRKPEDRPSTNELVNQLRRELWSEAINPQHFSDFMSHHPPDEKSSECPVPLTSALFLATN